MTCKNKIANLSSNFKYFCYNHLTNSSNQDMVLIEAKALFKIDYMIFTELKNRMQNT